MAENHWEDELTLQSRSHGFWWMQGCSVFSRSEIILVYNLVELLYNRIEWSTIFISKYIQLSNIIFPSYRRLRGPLVVYTFRASCKGSRGGPFEGMILLPPLVRTSDGPEDANDDALGLSGEQSEPSIGSSTPISSSTPLFSVGEGAMPEGASETALQAERSSLLGFVSSQ